jgi:hypothetical protein
VVVVVERVERAVLPRCVRWWRDRSSGGLVEWSSDSDSEEEPLLLEEEEPSPSSSSSSSSSSEEEESMSMWSVLAIRELRRTCLWVMLADAEEEEEEEEEEELKELEELEELEGLDLAMVPLKTNALPPFPN